MMTQTHTIEKLWNEQKIDIERLHNVIGGRYRAERGAGHTFATVVLMIHEALQGDCGNRYLYVGETEMSTILYAIRPMYNILTSEGFTVERFQQRNRLYVKDTDMTFVFAHPYYGFEQRFRGCLFDRVFIDLTPRAEWRYDRELTEIHIRTRGYEHG